MTTIQLHFEHQDIAPASLPTVSREAVRDLARTCLDNGIPFRITYPQAGRFRYPIAARFTSR